MSDHAPATWSSATLPSNPHPLVIQQGFGPLDPYHGDPSKHPQFDGRPRLWTHAEAYPDPQLMVQKVLIAAFIRPDALLQRVLPFVPYDGERIQWREFIAKIRPFGPFAPQAPLEQQHVQMREISFTMMWFGGQIMLDHTLRNTDMYTFLKSTNLGQLTGSMNATIYLEFMKHIAALPNIYFRIYNYYRRPDVNGGMGDNNALDKVLDAMAHMCNLPIVESGDLGTAALLQKIRTVLETHVEDDTWTLNFMIMPRELKDRIRIYPRRFESLIPEAYVNKVMYSKGLPADVKMLFPPLELDAFRDIPLFFTSPCKTARGPAEGEDPLRIPFITGQWWLIDPAVVQTYQVMDYNQGQWQTIYSAGATPTRHNTAGVLTLAANRGGHGAPNGYLDPNIQFFGGTWERRYAPLIVAFRHAMTFRASMIIAGHGGFNTGITAIGQNNANDYDLMQIRIEEANRHMRLGIFIAHEENFVVVPNALIVDCVGGTSASLWHSPRERLDSEPIVAANIPNGNRVHYYRPTPNSPYYGETRGKNHTNRTATSGDVFMYIVPNKLTPHMPDGGDPASIRERDNITAVLRDAYAQQRISLESARIICSSGRFRNEAANRNDLNWVATELDTLGYETCLRGTMPIPHIYDNGLRCNNNELVWRALGRMRTFDDDNLGWQQSGFQAGPLEPSTVASKLHWTGYPMPKLNDFKTSVADMIN